MKSGWLAIGLLTAMVVSSVDADANPCHVEASRDEWKYTDNMAIRLPAGTSNHYGEGPGHSVAFWDTPWGRLEADYLFVDMRDWATDIVVICTARVDARNAEIIRFKQWGENPYIGLRIEEGPHGFLIQLPVTPGVESDTAILSALLSVKFVNDPDKLIVTRRPNDAKGARTVMVENEIGLRRVLRIGDSVTSDHGILKEIRDDAIVVKEYRKRKWRTLLIPIRTEPKAKR